MPAFSGVSNAILPRISGTQPGGVLTPGYYSNLAFQMAGSPQNGPYSAVAPPPDPAGGYGIPSASGAAGGAAGGLLGTLAQNPSLAKTAYNTAAGLLSPAVGSPAWEAAITSGTSAGIPAASAIAAPTAGEVASSIGAPVGGDLYAGAAGAADAGAGSAAGSAAGGSATGAGTSALGTAAAAALPLAIAGLSFANLFGALPDDTLPNGAAFVSSLQGAKGWDPAFKQAAQQAYNQLGEAGFYQWLAQNVPGLVGAHVPTTSPAYTRPI